MKSVLCVWLAYFVGPGLPDMRGCVCWCGCVCMVVCVAVVSKVTGKPSLYYPRWRRTIKYGVSAVVSGVLLAGALGVMVLSINLQVRLRCRVSQQTLSNTPIALPYLAMVGAHPTGLRERHQQSAVHRVVVTLRGTRRSVRHEPMVRSAAFCFALCVCRPQGLRS